MGHPKPSSAADHLIAHRWQLGPAKQISKTNRRTSRAKRAVDHGHGVTPSRRKRPRRLCRPTSPLGRSGRPLALLLSSLFACSETLLSRFLVASPPVQDLLLSAKYLFGAARTVCHGLQCDIGCIFSSLYPSLAVPLLSRFAPSQRLVALRQTFVHRCHLPAGGS